MRIADLGFRMPLALALAVLVVLILLLAVAGPGYRYAVGRRSDHGLIARWFVDNPSFFDALIVNFVALHLFIGGIWLAAWIVTRAKRTP